MSAATTTAPATTATTPEETRPPERCDPSKIKPGSVFSRHSHGVVVRVEFEPRVRDTIYTLRNDVGFEWDVKGSNILQAEFSFADQSESETKDSRTKINQILVESSHTAMTVCYNKKPDADLVAKELATGRGTLNDKDWKKRVDTLMEGEERVMIGYHLGQFDDHQRLKFIESGVGPRLVDTRTIKWIIVNRTKYIVK